MTLTMDVLLIEDNFLDAHLFQSLIDASTLTPLAVYHVASVADAIATCQHLYFDVIVISCLPQLASTKTDAKLLEEEITRLQQIQAYTPQVPIVVMGSAADRTVATATLQVGAQDYLTKAELFSPQRIQQLGHQALGNAVVTTIQHALQRAEFIRQLSVNQDRYTLALQGANDGLWDWDLRRQSIYYSKRWCAMLGLQPSALDSNPHHWLSRIHPDDRPLFDQQLREHFQNRHHPFKCEYRLRHQDGSYRWMLSRGNSLWDPNGNAYRIAGSQTDITARKSLEKALINEKELAKIKLNSIGDAVITTDSLGNIEDFNPAAEKLTGWAASEAKRRPLTEVCPLIEGSSRTPLYNPAMRAIEAGHSIRLSNQLTLIAKTGQEFAISESVAPIRSREGDIVGTILVLRDVTEERLQANQLAWQASHDPLTQLHNRANFEQAVATIFQDPLSPETGHVLCYLDLDHFKIVNDTCGHMAGDQLLQQVAMLWRAQVRASDLLARLVGDEFGLLLYNCDVSRAHKIAEDLCESIRDFRFSYRDKIFDIGVSIGLVMITAEMGNKETLFRCADYACYQAKAQGRSRIYIYDDSSRQQSLGALGSRSHRDGWQVSVETALPAQLVQAFDTNQFQLHQETIAPTETAGATIEHREVLIRLRNTQSGQLMPPMGFIPTAERYQLMPQIDRWVLQQVITHVAKAAMMTSAGSNQLKYSINLSAGSLSDDSFLEFLQQQLSHHQVLPSSLCFEITETVAIANIQQTTQFTMALKALGCQVALDNFGSGISSLTYLKQLPIDYLKIDGRFIKEAVLDSITYTMLKAIQQVAQAMQVKTVAKCVESKSILETVKKLGLDFVQGYEIGLSESLMLAAPLQPRPQGQSAPFASSG